MKSNDSHVLRRMEITCALLFTMSLMNAGCAAGAQSSKSAGATTATRDTAAEIKEQEVNEETITSADVSIEGRSVVTVYEPVAGFTPQDRAERIAQRIIAVAEQHNVPVEAVRAERHADWTEIRAGEKLLMVVTEGDARAAAKPRETLAAQDAGNIRQAIQNYRHDHSWNSILRGVGYTALVTVLLFPVLWLVRKARLKFRTRLEKWIEVRKTAEIRKTTWHIVFTYGVSLFVALATVFRWLLIIGIVEGYLTLVMSFFPYTRSISLTVTDWLVATLEGIGSSTLEYLPNLIVVAIIVAVASQVLKLITMIFEEIAKGNLNVRGFYSDWSEPTAKLIRMLIIVLVAVIIFPYLPGSKSPAFQGVSIFVGVLLSLGSSSAVANGIAGIILTYMRSFLVGDWVKIGDTIGEVVEKNILVTRILTPKQEVITIPNSTVMSGSVMNYTREANNQGVIFHTTVTIGYDAPWRTVHQLLIDAALATEHVLAEPAPFVLQTALNDFYVAYELNAYTDKPRKMQFIYSELHENIQDRFNGAGVEICSPHFSALRDGNAIAIPEQYVPSNYQAPRFRVMDASEKREKAVGQVAD